MATGDEWLSVVAEAKAPMYEHVFIMTILEGESTQWKADADDRTTRLALFSMNYFGPINSGLASWWSIANW
jgi:hypothetical protein